MAAYNTFESVKAKAPGSLFDEPQAIVLRDEQKEAVKKAKAMFGTQKAGGPFVPAETSKQFLWNAKMRFGKTLCALQLAREMNVRRMLIVTHRPVVAHGFFEDFEKIFKLDPAIRNQYDFGTKSDKDGHGNYYDLERFLKQSPDNHYIFFASMQYLRRSTLVGGDNDEQLKKDILQNTDWDLVVVDEAHEGTRTALGQRVIDMLRKSKTKMLHLSGTPFNLYGDFNDKEIYTWDYIQEQQAKQDWPKKHPNEDNPYAELPQMKIFTYDLGKLIDGFIEEGASFKFSEFFRTWTGNPKADKANMPEGKKGRFVHEEAVKQFLDKLCEDSTTSNYPFSTDNYKDTFNHTLWIVPGVKEAKALQQLLHEHELFGSFDAIINVAGNNAEDEEREDALEKVKKAIGKQPENTYTITISCGRLTTGVTVKPWTAVFYLKGSEMTSAATYMQTIFRVQSPAIINGKMKRECYVFDFAPDRSLKMVAETAKFSSHAKKTIKKNEEGENLTQEERDKETMKEFLKLCPVISLDGGAMVEYDANKLFKQLESVYIDRLVTSGFNDNCLYNPIELMNMDSAELNKLGAKIAKTSNMEKPKNASPNGALQMNHLTEEERKKLEEARRKAKENRKNKKDPYEGLSDDEIAALEAEKERKAKERKERENRISNIRGISLRIPLLMYGGADAGDPNEDLTVENFTRKIKDESWEEFMPKGITKKDFNIIKKCYNQTRFEEAGKRYRALAREADSMHTEDRIKRIADIFACFHNPDKETVLTPWRVVNMHMSDTLGGYCFFNEKFDGPNQKQILDKNGNVADIVNTAEPRYVNRGQLTKSVFENNEAQILEINSKTGLYPLYVAYSLYRRRMKDFYDAELIGKQSVEEEQVVWDDIVANNIFVICNTPMAARITERTLFGFREVYKMNIKSEKLVERATTEQDELVSTIKSVGFWNGNRSKDEMKFTAVVGNPPYQQKKDSTSDAPTYHLFMEIAFQLSDIVSFITPGRFLFDAGKTPKEFNKMILNDEHFKVVMYEEDSSKVFENVSIKGGVAVSLRNANENYGKIGTFTKSNEINSILHKVMKSQFTSFKELVYAPESYRLSKKFHKEHPEIADILSNGHLYDITTNIFDKLSSFIYITKPNDGNDYIELYGRQNNERKFAWIRRDYVDNHDNLDKYKVFVAKSNGSGAFGETLTSPIVATPAQGHTQTFISIGKFDTEYEANSCLNFIKTKFARTLLSTVKVTQDNKKETWSNVPLLDFTQNSIIDWNKSIHEIDKQLYDYYDLNTVERNFVEDNVKPMD